MKISTILAGVAAFGLTALNLEARVWTDSSGQHKVEAEFVSLNGENVTIKSSEGKLITLPLDKLSEADQAFAKSVAAAPPAAGDAGSAAEYASKFAGALEAGNLGIAIGMLPPSYQKDLSGLLSEFGNSMDPVLWNSILSVGKDIGYILTEKKEMVTGSQIYATMNRGGELEKIYDQVAGSINSLFNNPAITLEALKKGDVASLNGLGSGGMTIMGTITVPSVAKMAEDLKEMKAEVVSETEDAATLRLTVDILGESEPQELEFKKVEGHWVDAQLADGWPTIMAQAREGLTMLKSPEFAEIKAEITEGVGMVNGIVNGLKEAETGEDFKAVLDGPFGEIINNAKQTKNINSARMVLMGCAIYSADKGKGAYPESLTKMEDLGILEEGQIEELKWQNPETDEMESWLYFGNGLRNTDPFGTILIASPKPSMGKRVVGYADGSSVRKITEAEYQEQMAKQKKE